MFHPPPLNPLITLVILFSVTTIVISHSTEHRCILRDNPTVPVVLPPSRLNDDYCDCQDGTDETRTSACPNGTFTCTNAGHRSTKIPSSRVHDGYCDCCDGSDEPHGICTDTCATLHKAAIADAERRAAHVRRGLTRRAEYVTEAARRAEDDKKKLNDLQAQLDRITNAMSRADSKLEQLRTREKWIVKEDPTPIATAASEEITPSSDPTPTSIVLPTPDEETADGDGLDEDFNYAANAVGEPQQVDHPEPSDGSPSAAAPAEKVVETKGTDEGEDVGSTEGNNDGEHGTTSDETPPGDEALDEKGIDHSAPDPEQEDDPEDTYHEEDDDDADVPSSHQSAPPPSDDSEVDAADVNVDAICASLDGETSGNAVVRRMRFLRNMAMARMHKLSPKLFPVPSGSALADLPACIREAENVKWQLQSKKTDIEGELSKLRKKDSSDFGADGALRQLDGRCIKSKILQYEFEHCPFDLVRQYEHGSAIATLGRFSKMETDASGGQIMVYRDGDHCWNGPVRRIKVHLLCGDREEIESVDEPNRCSYAMKFRTPAVCEQRMVDEILADVNGSQNSKDEL